MIETVNVALKGSSHQYQISIGPEIFEGCGSWLKLNLSDSAKKIAVISNRKVFSLYGDEVTSRLIQAGFEVFVHQIGDGERFKNFRTLEKTLRFFSEIGLKRSDVVIALGGGVVGDLTGFASSIYLRGVPFFQIPTTLLSMIDSSVGGKTAVNTSFGKNLIGTFYQPNGVLIDIATLRTLPRRELTAGFCEAVKQGAIADKKLFSQTQDFLQTYSIKRFTKHFSEPEFLIDLAQLIAAQVAFKAEIVKGDEQESPARTDLRSRKILNFGHTVGHALEKITGYKYFKHGEAVGLGILVAGEISKTIANFCQNELDLLNDVVELAGNLPNCKNIEAEKVIEAFNFDKKNVGNSLQWILLEEIGKPRIVSSERISGSLIVEAIKVVLEKHSKP
jgi:3-dehydroquinate synthase